MTEIQNGMKSATMCWQPIDLLLHEISKCSIGLCVYKVTHMHGIFGVVYTKARAVLVSKSKIYGLYSAVNFNRTTQMT
jgi:hypothetical protein